MCFSATASMVVGCGLIVMGIATIRKVKMPGALLFASIPLIFASQQITEGMLWLIIRNAIYTEMQQDLTYLYLFIAEVLWPVWIPLSLLLLEKKGYRQYVLIVLLLAGITVATFLCFRLLTFGVQASVVNGHISYLQKHNPSFTTLGKFPYLFVTLVPFFFSRFPYIRLIGIAVVAAFLVARLLFFEQFLTSVWCFYAAVVSPLVYLAVHVANKERVHFNKHVNS